MDSSSPSLPQKYFLVVSVVAIFGIVLIYRDAMNYYSVSIVYRPPAHSGGNRSDSHVIYNENTQQYSFNMWNKNITNGSTPLKKIYINMLWKYPIDFSNCRAKCEIVRNLARTDECQALVFEQVHIPGKKPARMPNQVWIYLTHEPPVYSSTRWSKDFNWTMSYRRDSEIYFPWGILVKRNTTLKRDYDQIFKNKTGNIAWLVSNCHTQGKREVYMKALRQYATVDQVGRCGGTKCPRERTEKCRRELGMSHKFYFAFENSLCIDYTSEKAWLLYHYGLPTIPITRGSTTVSTQLPNGTYINALDFSGPRELVDYLNKLGNDKERYIAMLKEKDKYTALDQPDNFERAVCTICEKISTNDIQPTNLDIVQWLKEGGCILNPDLGI